MIESLMYAIETDIMKMLDDHYQLKAADAMIRKRGNDAKELKGSFFNQHTICLLAGLVDIYSIFGTLGRSS